MATRRQLPGFETFLPEPGERHFKRVNFGYTHGGFELMVPIHFLRGRRSGPTLLIQAGLNGLEIEPATVLPTVLQEINLDTLYGTLLVVPLLNTSGFEFQQAASAWDDREMHALGRGDAHGTVSERLLDSYFRTFVTACDALLEIRTGAQWSYAHYVAVHAHAPASAVALAASLGLRDVLVNLPEDNTPVAAAARAGAAAVTVWIGGGPGLRDHREEDAAQVRRAVLGALQHLGMLDAGSAGGGAVRQLEHVATLTHTHERGLVFMDASLRGGVVRQGDRLGYVRHPFSGVHLEDVRAPADGVLIDAGLSWPLAPEGTPLAIIGRPVTDAERRS